jgi:hypothetical protein
LAASLAIPETKRLSFFNRPAMFSTLHLQDGIDTLNEVASMFLRLFDEYAFGLRNASNGGTLRELQRGSLQLKD